MNRSLLTIGAGLSLVGFIVWNRHRVGSVDPGSPIPPLDLSTVKPGDVVIEDDSGEALRDLIESLSLQLDPSRRVSFGFDNGDTTVVYSQTPQILKRTGIGGQPSLIIP